MSKELEALERLKTAPTFMGGTTEYQFCTKSETLLLQDYAIVKQALLELQSIKEAKSSEALKTLEVLDKTISPLLEPVLAEYEDDLSDKITANYFALKQSLLNAEKEHKALEIIKEKRVNVGTFIHLTKILKKDYEKCKALNNTFGANICETEKELLTKEEFNLLKEVLE